MQKTIGIFIYLSIILAACAAAETPTPAPVEPTAAMEFTGNRLTLDRGELFAGSGVCVGCHTFMKDETGMDVSIDKSWSATMKANAARDPYYLATVRSEVIHAPELSETIQSKCASCHMPMAFKTARTNGEAAVLLDDGFRSADHPLHGLALDAVSCSLCHQLEADNFGSPESFGGGYAVNVDLPTGERNSYGPYQVAQEQALAMKAASGHNPVQGMHMADSEHCATCHNLVTPYLDASGQVAGEFPEQAVYSEWLNSAYKDQSSCIDCHMPVAQGGVQLSITGGPPRSPFSRHVFVGGNAFMLKILQKNGEEIGITTHPDNLDLSIAATEEIIGRSSATLALENIKLEGSTLTGEVAIASQTGHKFPSAYPSRRAWLHITISDAAGAVIFESGAVDAQGRIAGNDNDDDPARFEPHYLTLTAADQVQIYETILHNSDGEVTTRLLRAAAYVKDNRILPQGFDLQNAPFDTQVFGVPAEDADFTAGGDRLALAVDLGAAQGPFTVKAELLYQTIGYRWAQNLMAEEGAEVEAFRGYYASVPNLPLLAASAETTLER